MVQNPSTVQRLQAESAAKHQKMVTTPVSRLVISLAVPTVASQLITVIYNTADTYFVSRISMEAAAAVGVVFALMSIIQAFGFGIGMGANSIISRRLGAKKDEDAHRCASSALFAALLFGTVLLVCGELFLKPLLKLLGATETVLPYAMDYTRYILLGAPLMCGSFVLNNILRSEGETQFAMWGICSGGILNAVLDPILIFHCDLGIGGAAIATVLSQGVSFLILSSFLERGKSIVRFRMRYVSYHWQDYWMIFSSGIPTICRQGLGSISSAVLNVLAAGYGDATLAAITIANKIYMLVRQLIIGIGQGMQPAAGYNYGAGDLVRVRKIFAFSCMAGSAVCLAGALLIFPFADAVISWFRPDAEVIRIGRTALYFGCAVMPLMAYSTFVNQLSQVLGFRLGATLLASSRQGIFFFPAAWLLPAFFGIAGLAALQPAADLCTFLISVPYQLRFSRKHLKLNRQRL